MVRYSRDRALTDDWCAVLQFAQMFDDRIDFRPGSGWINAIYVMSVIEFILTDISHFVIIPAFVIYERHDEIRAAFRFIPHHIAPACAFDIPDPHNHLWILNILVERQHCTKSEEKLIRFKSSVVVSQFSVPPFLRKAMWTSEIDSAGQNEDQSI